MSRPEGMPTARELADYRAALHAIAAAVDAGRRVILTGAQLRALERVTTWRRLRAEGTYRGT